MKQDRLDGGALSRRSLLRYALAGAGALALPVAWMAARDALDQRDAPDDTGLLPADPNGWRLRPGFTSRVVAVSGARVAGSDFVWHSAPDGGAVFADPDGRWRYVSNSERPEGGGGVGMLRFDADGNVDGGAELLTGSTMNCAGGATPWGTWLSCEEWSRGWVWEVDPTGAAPAERRGAMGRFQHEAATADPDHGVFYLTEDLPDGAFYRFRPTTWGDLRTGDLEVLTETDAGLAWARVPDPSAAKTLTNQQVPGTRTFDGGEGAWYASGEVFFTTKGDNRVWALDVEAMRLRVIYDDDTNPNPQLNGVDNLIMAPSGELLVVEDGDDLQIVSVTTAGQVNVLARLTGVSDTELTGLAIDPSGRRLYVSSQRNPGTTYQITGPFAQLAQADAPRR